MALSASFPRNSFSEPRDILPLGDHECIAANQLSGGLEWIKGGKTIASLPMNGALCVIPAQ